MAARGGMQAALLTVLAGYDPDDPRTEPLNCELRSTIHTISPRDGLKGVRIG